MEGHLGGCILMDLVLLRKAATQSKTRALVLCCHFFRKTSWSAASLNAYMRPGSTSMKVHLLPGGPCRLEPAHDARDKY